MVPGYRKGLVCLKYRRFILPDSSQLLCGGVFRLEGFDPLSDLCMANCNSSCSRQLEQTAAMLRIRVAV